jgi:hypothetical protein
MSYFQDLRRFLMANNPIVELRLSDLNVLERVELTRTPTLKNVVLTNLYSATDVDLRSNRINSL